MAGRTGDVRMAQLLERAVGALYLGMIGGAIQAEEIVEIVVPWGRRRRRESRSALQVVANSLLWLRVPWIQAGGGGERRMDDVGGKS